VNNPALLVFTTLALLSSAVSCAKVKSSASEVGEIAVESARAQEPEILEFEKTLADSAGAYLGRAIRDEVLTRVTMMWDTLLSEAEAASDRIVTELAAKIQYDINHSLQLLIEDNLDLAERRGPKVVELLVASAMLEATHNVDALVSTAIRSASVGLRDDLKPMVLDVVNVLGDSLVLRIQEVDRALAESRTVSTIRDTILYLALGAAAVLVAVAAVIATAIMRRQRKSLNVLVDAIDEAGDKPLPNLRADIKCRARDAKVHGFLTDLVSKRRQERED
jgi:type IV secretory pathway VirB2 component (pilin)